MKILRLTLAGFGPYKNEQRVDFERFDDDGIFLITGKTGAGKSSILDAICYAFYASVPRYETTQQSLRSDHCSIDDPTFVELEFRANGTDYRVRRSPEYERPKRRGNGTTQEPATAVLFVRNEGGWEGIAARAVDVARELDGILGLTKDQFLQVILLAQNRFQKFLRANNDERQAVLRTLFGTRRFEQVETALAERRKALEAELADSRASIASLGARAAALLRSDEAPAEPDDAWFETARTELDAAHSAAAAEAEAADALATAAESAYRALDDARKLQVRRDAAGSRLELLEAERDAIGADQAVVASALRAAAVWPHVVLSRSAAAAADDAITTEADARTAYRPFGDEASSKDALKATIDGLTRELGTLESAIGEEALLVDLADDIRESRNRLQEVHTDLAEAGERLVELPKRIDAETKCFLDAQVRASAEDSAAERVERVAAALAAATTAVTVDRSHTEALVAEKRASAALAAATTRVDALLKQRLSGHAAELASQLVEGEPCAVCGSVAHPDPAESDGAAVTEADVDEALDAVTTRRDALDSARDAARRLATELAEVRARSNGKTVAQLESDLMAAESALANAESARTEVRAREAELSRLRQELGSANAELERLREGKERAAEQLAEHRNTRKSVQARIAKARGTFDSVTSRVEHLLGHLDAATAVVEAVSTVVACRTAATDASSTLADQLAQHDFADEHAVEAARRDRAEIRLLEARIRAHEQGTATAAATLAEDGMAELPADPIETEAARAEMAAARASRDAARDIKTSLAERAAQLSTIVTSARALHRECADRAREYAQFRELAGAVQGLEPNTKRMRLETYVLAAQLEEIVAAANARLGTMTHGRFALEHDDGVQYRNARSGLGLSILDQHTGRSRATHSLSGGETFLASLALALGLAEVVQNQAGGITLDTLFIDEGFGSLDSETLETAMSTLDGLRAGGRTVGLISHVDTMKEQIPAKLRVCVTDSGHSEISTGHQVPESGYVPVPPERADADAHFRDLVAVGAG